MAHNEERGHWIREAFIGLGTGILYGVTSVLVGHPFDTIKTKMQAQHGHVEATNGGMIKSFTKVFKTEGIRGLYRGAVPPILGSGLYRSVQFAVYEGLWTKWSSKAWRQTIPGTGGLENRVVVAAFTASFVRAVMECPIELAKVKKQTSQTYKFHELYKGFGLQLTRTSGVMVTYFIIIDTIKRKSPSTFSTPLGQFLASSCAATFGFWMVWPFEVLKNQVQADMTVDVRDSKGVTKTVSNPTLFQRAQYLIQQHGVKGLYRGILPGTVRSFLSNGVSMVVMMQAHKLVSQLGLRN